MRRLLCLFLLLASSLNGAGNEFTEEAPASSTVKVVVNGTSDEQGVSCTLSRVEDGKETQVLWSIRAEDRSPLDWFNLLSADENNGELAVLVESGMSEIRLLRLKLPGGETVGDKRFHVPGLLLRRSFEMGVLQVRLPDRIEWKNDAGVTRTFIVEGNRLRGVGDVGFDPADVAGGYSAESTQQTTGASGSPASSDTPTASNAETGSKQGEQEAVQSSQEQGEDIGVKGWALGIVGAVLLVLTVLAIARKRRSSLEVQGKGVLRK